MPQVNGQTNGHQAVREQVSESQPARLSQLDGKAPESTDFANYFCTYGYLYHQKDMLEDHKRTGAYYQAVMQNRRQFKDKVVLDVGTGSGILAIFAAMAGASKVYAVEATAMAKMAADLVEHNQLSHVVTVIQGTMESVDLPEKVDIIISEWMGYFLLRESMLDTVLHARDKFLKPGGALYPSHARLYLAPACVPHTPQRVSELQGAMHSWHGFVGDIQQCYGVDMGCLNSTFQAEQQQYYLATSAWADVHPSKLQGPPVCIRNYDLLQLSQKELAAPLHADLTMEVLDSGNVNAFCGWFDVIFAGSPENPTDFEVPLSTAPDPRGSTHWGQQLFSLHPAISCSRGDQIRGDVRVVRRKENHRLMEVHVNHSVVSPGCAPGPKVESHFLIE